jgi:hypothetical protein
MSIADSALAGAWLVLWLAAAGPALAQCPEGGTPVSPFAVGERWAAAHSLYCVTSGVFGVGLTNESSVTVKVWGNYVFEVAGQLQVKGASSAPVVFTPDDPRRRREIHPLQPPPQPAARQIK